MNRTEHLLTILGEECAEIIQRVTKALRFGLDEVEPGQTLTNADRIAGELADLDGVLQMLTDSGAIPEICGDAVRAKIAKVEKFLEYSETCGTLSG